MDKKPIPYGVPTAFEAKLSDVTNLTLHFQTPAGHNIGANTKYYDSRIPIPTQDALGKRFRIVTPAIRESIQGSDTVHGYLSAEYAKQTTFTLLPEKESN